jgi:hypothetical protein
MLPCADGQLQQCRVAPHFPSRGQSIADNVLCSLLRIDTSDTLLDLLDSAPSTGFTLLSRYVDTLATLHALPITPLQLVTADDKVLDLGRAQILAQGQHSLVLLLTPDSKFVVKISRTSLIDRERRVHGLVDGSSPHLRKMVAGAGGYGEVKGAGPGLAFLLLEGVGDPFAASHAASDASLANLWEQAASGLTALHQKRVLHRDCKPANMILIHGALLLNDFDIACEFNDETLLKQVTVGTKEYRSPRLSDRWRERDDWLGLALSFLSLRVPFPFANKQASLQNALTLPWVPRRMKERIEECDR